MAGFEVKREEVSGKVILRVSGTIDGQAATELQLLIAGMDPRAELVVDFAQVREFPDLSVGVLTRALASRTVQLRGLRTHQARMFEYFGIRGLGGTERAYYTPEELLVA